MGACLPAIVFYVRMWRDVPNPVERGRVAVLLVIFGISIIFWAVFQLSSTALPIWARDNTDRVPGPIAQVVVDRVPAFAENAPPKYFVNAGPETPRASRETFVVVDKATYERLKAEP